MSLVAQHAPTKDLDNSKHPRLHIARIQNAAKKLPREQVLRITRGHLMGTNRLVVEGWDTLSDGAKRFVRPHFDSDGCDLVRTGHLFCGDLHDEGGGFIKPGVREDRKDESMAIGVAFRARIWIQLAIGYDRQVDADEEDQRAVDEEWKAFCRETAKDVAGELLKLLAEEAQRA